MINAIIILGMHRSGTSCLAGCLKQLGLNLGPVSEYNLYNKKGNQENRLVFRLNESILKYNKGAWNSPPVEDIKLNQELRENLKGLVSKYNSYEKPWGIKDPRMLLTYNTWQSLLPEHALVGTFRHPLAVAESLFAREAFPVPVEKGLELWKVYNSKLIKLYEKKEFKVINFDLPQNQYIVRLKQIAKFLRLRFNEEAVFFEPGLRNQKTYSYEQCPDTLKPIYSKLLEMN